MTGGDYRDELAAAHARIEELELRLAEARGGGVDATPWLGELQAKRAAVVAEGLKGLGNPKRRWRVRLIILAVTMTLATVLSVMAGTLIPFLPLGILTLHPGWLVVWTLGRNRELKTKTELAKLDDKIADVKRMASMMGAAQRVRVDVGKRDADARPAAEDVSALLDEASGAGDARRR